MKLKRNLFGGIKLSVLKKKRLKMLGGIIRMAVWNLRSRSIIISVRCLFLKMLGFFWFKKIIIIRTSGVDIYFTLENTIFMKQENNIFSSTKEMIETHIADNAIIIITRG